MPDALLAVMITVYGGPFIGQPLYCDTASNHLFYTTDHEWIAWDFAMYGGQCGDIIQVTHDGVRRSFRALDSGPFGRYCVEMPGGCVRIVADLPVHLAWFPGLSVKADSVRNLSELARWCEGRGLYP